MNNYSTVNSELWQCFLCYFSLCSSCSSVICLRTLSVGTQQWYCLRFLTWQLPTPALWIADTQGCIFWYVYFLKRLFSDTFISGKKNICILWYNFFLCSLYCCVHFCGLQNMSHIVSLSFRLLSLSGRIISSQVQSLRLSTHVRLLLARLPRCLPSIVLIINVAHETSFFCFWGCLS